MKSKFLGRNPVKHAHHAQRAWKQRASIGRMLRAAWSGDYRITFLTKAILLIGVLYIFSPIDIIPDFLPILGWIDDLGMVFLLLGRLASEAERFQRTGSTGLKRVA